MKTEALKVHKTRLRNRFLDRRRALEPGEREAFSRRIERHVLGLSELASPTAVGLYAAQDGEVQTRRLFSSLRERGCAVCFPRSIRKERRLEFASVASWSQLKPGAWNILEPSGPEIAVHELGLVLLPGIGFSTSGVRLGYGGGYYDRTLEYYRGCAVGLGFGFQLVDELPTEPTDRAMDFIITEDGVTVVRQA